MTAFNRFIRGAALLCCALVCAAANAALDADGAVLGRYDGCPISCVRITVHNSGGSRVSYQLESVGDYARGGRITLSAPPLEGGDTRVHYIALPFSRWPNFMITDSLGDRKSVGITNSSYSNTGRRFLNVSEIESQATPKELDDFTKEYQVWTGIPAASYSGSSSTPDPVISQIEPRDLPQSWMCYAPFHAVFVRQTAYARLTQPEQDALNRWVESGGYLSVYASDHNSTEALGLGTVERRKDSPISMTSGSWPAEWRRSDQLWLQSYGSGASDPNFPYLVHKPGGRTGAFFIATLFLVLAGPVNYFYYKRKGRIRMLMLSLPAVSLSFCLLITAYFIGTQGFQRRGGTVSLSTLDERTDRGFTYARNSLFSGLYPLGGFRFKQDTAFLPLKNAEEFEMDMTNGTVLKSGLFLPSTNFQYFAALPYQSRERLVFDPKSKTVMNGFEHPVEGVVLHDGTSYYAAGKISAGGKATATVVNESDVPAKVASNFDDRLVRLLTERLLSADERRIIEDRMIGFAAGPMKQPGIHYAVLMTQNPESVQTGVPIRADRNCNVVVGVSDANTSATPSAKAEGA